MKKRKSNYNAIIKKSRKRKTEGTDVDIIVRPINGDNNPNMINSIDSPIKLNKLDSKGMPADGGILLFRADEPSLDNEEQDDLKMEDIDGNKKNTSEPTIIDDKDTNSSKLLVWIRKH